MKKLNESNTLNHLGLAMAAALMLCVGAGRSAEPASNPVNVKANEVPGTSAEKIAPEAAEHSGAVVAPKNIDTNLITMNFHGAPLDQVLNHLSETAGFIINIKPGTTVRGKVEAYSNQPMTKEEALNLLNTALNQNGLGAVQNGRTLTIMSKDEIKTQSIPVIQGSDPEKIPMTDRIVTQIMPVRFVEAAQLVKDLQPLVPLQTTMSANEAGNSIVMTDTQANIHKVAEIIRAIDLGAEDFVEVKVFHLTNSSPVEMSELLSNLFPDESKTGGTSQSPFAGRMGRFSGGLASLFGGGGGQSSGSGERGGQSGNQNQRIKKRNRVIAVPDQRTTSVIVSANRDLMEQIADVVGELDARSQGKPMVKVFPLQYADPQEAVSIFQDTFGSTTANNRNQQNQNNVLQNRTTQGNSQSSGSTSRTTPTAGSRGGGGAATGFGP